MKMSFYLIIGKNGENVYGSRLNELIASSLCWTLLSINGYEFNYVIRVDLEWTSDKLLAIECDFIKMLLLLVVMLLLFFVKVGYVLLSCGDNEKLVLIPLVFLAILDCFI